MLKNNKINIYGCLLKLIYTPVFATKNLLITGGFFIFTHLYQSIGLRYLGPFIFTFILADIILFHNLIIRMVQ